MYLIFDPTIQRNVEAGIPAGDSSLKQRQLLGMVFRQLGNPSCGKGMNTRRDTPDCFSGHTSLLSQSLIRLHKDPDPFGAPRHTMELMNESGDLSHYFPE